MFIKLHSTFMMDIMNFWSLHLALLMHPLHFRQLWTRYSDLYCIDMSWFLIDDILIYSPTWVDHLEHLVSVHELLRQNQLVTKQSNAYFDKNQLTTWDILSHLKAYLLTLESRIHPVTGTTLYSEGSRHFSRLCRLLSTIYIPLGFHS